MKNKWLVGARLKTLPAAIVPVLVGTAGANRDLLNKSINLNLFVYALLVALFLQIGVNYANDYSDGVKGTDHDRIGPTRLVASGLASAAEVRGLSPGSRRAALGYGRARGDGRGRAEAS